MSASPIRHAPAPASGTVNGAIQARVSIVMPAYNHASYVVAALDSVRAQTLAEWELVIIDDGSTDGTYEVITGYLDRARDPRIRLFRQRNAGSHATINRGLALATARYLAILNSDDCFAPDRLERLCAIAERRGGDLFAVTAIRLIDGSGATVGPGHPMYGWWRMYTQMLEVYQSARLMSTSPFRDALLWGNFTITTSNFFVSRGLFQRLGPFRRFRYVLDWEYAIRVALRCPDSFVFLDDEHLLDYRLHGQNTIFGGAIRNHIEASYLLRSTQRSIARSGRVIPEYAVRRVRYLDRFIRQEQARIHDRDLATREHKLALTEAHVQKLDQLAARLQEKIASAETTATELVCLVESQLVPPVPSQLGLEALLATLRTAVERREETLRSQLATIEVLGRELSAMRDSRWWRVGAPLRWATRFLRRAGSRLRASWLERFRLAGATMSASQDTTIWRNGGRATPDRGAARQHGASTAKSGRIARSPLCTDAFAQWLTEDERRLAFISASARTTDRTASSPPPIALLVPSHNAKAEQLSALLASICNQINPSWELAIVDDGASGPEVRHVVEAFALRDGRIRFLAGTISGRAIDAAIGMPAAQSPGFVVFIEPGIELAPTALLHLERAIEMHPGADVFYSDHDHLDAAGLRCLPRFKPDWSPTLLWTADYIGGLVCFRRALLDASDLPHCAGIGDSSYRLTLRIASHARQVCHVPEVLYHRRLPADRFDELASLADDEVTRDAVAAFLDARYASFFSHIEHGVGAGVFVPRFRVPTDCVASIIIPTKDRIDLLSPCVASICELSTWRQFEILILDNNSTEIETAQYLSELAAREPRVRVIPANIPFNWSKLNNAGRRAARGEVLIFLNNDTRVLSADWLERLMEVALLPDVATVGPMLLFEDGTIQHAGVVVGMGGWADHVYRTCAAADDLSPYVASTMARNVLANTGAAMAIASGRFDLLGGFDESFEICGSDVEIGIRAHRRGLFNVYLPSVRLFHLESKTRSPHVPEGDFIQSDIKYAPYRLGGDPYYNPNLSLASTTPMPRYPAWSEP
jgi:glycosyltransferase involved in cell wall biosynthesis